MSVDRVSRRQQPGLPPSVARLCLGTPGRIIERVPRFSGGRWWRVAVLTAALCAFVDIASPFEHHDLACHLKTPAHCTACASSLASTSPTTVAGAAAMTLSDLGSAVTRLPQIEGTRLTVRGFGRAPPASL